MNQGARRILVADDEAEIVQLIASWLRANHYEVMTASNGKEALDAVYSKKPDLIILDLMMPGIDGWKVSQTLKADDRYKQIPIIILSGLIGEEGAKGKDFERGDFFFRKPFDLPKLLEKVKELLGQS